MLKKTMQSYEALITAKVWTKQDCQRVAKALNALRFTSTDDHTRTFMINWKDRFNARDSEYKITKEHSDQGINYLRNYCFTTKGAVRKSCNLGWSEQEIIKNFKRFAFVGYHTEYNNYGYPFYHIIYRCYDKFGRYFDYCPMHWSDPLVVYVNMNTTSKKRA